MSKLVQSMIMSVVRKGLVALGTWVIATGYVTGEDWSAFVVGAVPVVAGVIWSLWLKLSGSHQSRWSRLLEDR